MDEHPTPNEHLREVVTISAVADRMQNRERGKKMYTIVEGTERDIDTWMELVKSVRWNFPGLETEDALKVHRNTVVKFMAQKRAICAKDKGSSIIGVLLFSLKYNMICCLAVAEPYRNRGIGSRLLACALKRLDRTKPITVSTFREEDEKGIAPRALYQKFGFVPDELTEEFGYPNQTFVLYPEQQTPIDAHPHNGL